MGIRVSNDDREVHRPLITRGGLGALALAVLAVLCVLLPAAVRRQALALEVLPDALSLAYLELNLERRPADPQLRLAVAGKLLQAGQLERARVTVAPLVAAGSAQARELALAIDRSAWAAIPEHDVPARAQALARVLADIDAIDLSQASPEAVQRMAELCWSLAESARAAQLLEQLARRELPDHAAHVRAAEAALLRADLGKRAVELNVYFAERGPSVEYALRALELAQGALRPRESLALAERLRAQLGADEPQLMAASLRLAEAIDVKLAYDLARRLLRKLPGEPALHRRVARLAEWNGDSLRALDEYVWLTRHAPQPEDRARAIELARANWDLPRLRDLLRGGASTQRASKPTGPRSQIDCAARNKRGSAPACGVGVTSARRPAALRQRSSCQAASAARARPTALDLRRRQLLEEVSLDETLGDAPAALAAIEAALRGPLAVDPAVWQLRVDVLRRSGDTTAAIDALAALVDRFPSEARALALAELLLALGRTNEALLALSRAPEPHAEAFLRTWFDVAWEAGDLGRARELAAKLSQSPGASAWDVARLWQLQRNDGDPQVPLATARAGFERWKSPELLRLLIASTERLQDDSRVATLLEQAEKFGDFRSDPGYWRQRITLHQRLAFDALESKEYVAAKLQLGEAEKALQLAPEQAPADVYEQLWTSQHAQAIALALEAGDSAALARVFQTYGAKLPIRQRVYVLRRLNREAEARALAQYGAADPTLPQSDRAALRAEFPEPSAAEPPRGEPDYARAYAEFFDSDGLATLTSRAQLQLDGERYGLKLSAAFIELTPQSGLRSLQPVAVHDLGVEVGGRIAGTELDAGVTLREQRDPRPYGRWRQQLVGDRDRGLAASLDVNSLSIESAQLRLLGAQDELALHTSLGLGGDYYVTARAGGSRYLTRDRDYLGAGLTLDAGVGRSFQLPNDFGRAAVRVTGRAAPRFHDADRAAREDARQPGTWIPESSAFSGVGASLARGELDVPRAGDPALRFLLDGAIGVLWPDRKLGFSGQAGIGTSILGRDQLSAQLGAGNVVGAQPYWSASASYAFGLE